MRFISLLRLLTVVLPTAGIEWFFLVKVGAFLAELNPDMLSWELLEESRRFRLRITLPLRIDELSLLSLGPALSYLLFLVLRYVVSISSPGRRCSISLTSLLLMALLAQSNSAVTSINCFSLVFSYVKASYVLSSLYFRSWIFFSNCLISSLWAVPINKFILFYVGIGIRSIWGKKLTIWRAPRFSEYS